MSMQRILEKNDWNTFVISRTRDAGSEFLQSWEWGLFQKELGRESYFLKIQDDNGIISQCLFIKYKLPFNKCYLYSPRPLVFNEEHLKILIEGLKELTGKEKTIFIRCDLRSNNDLEGFKRINDVQPSKTTILDLRKTEEEILFPMHHKTRYNIRLAKRYGVKVFRSEKEEHQKIFLNLLHQTAKREKFRIYSDDYYIRLLNFKSDFSRLYLAEHQNKILAAHLLIFFGRTATYLHGASSRENREVMAPYLLHWESIKEAKKSGFHFYDFWGIDEKKWPGLTRFKMGFGGRKILCPGTFDLPLSDYWCNLYKLSKTCFRLF